MDKITIRPSSIDTFFNCPYQWYNTFLLGKSTIPGARAAIGTAIHAAAEALWIEAMLTKKKEVNSTMLTDAAIANYQEAHQQGLQYDEGEDQNTAETAVVEGVYTFIEDIVPFTPIPLAVEKRVSIKMDHPVVEEIAGTIDYLNNNTVADLKTSKRKPIPESYVTQQSVYKFLAEKNGYQVSNSVIQGIVLKAKPEGHILKLQPKVERARFMLNSMLDTLRLYYEDKVPPEVLFRGNPKYYLCSPKYCSLYGKSCGYSKGE